MAAGIAPNGIEYALVAGNVAIALLTADPKLDTLVSTRRMFPTCLCIISCDSLRAENQCGKRFARQPTRLVMETVLAYPQHTGTYHKVRLLSKLRCPRTSWIH